ncbi:MAG TPA: protein kinase [Acidimicrobiales bacterium]|nr:protein kinase [Acidimicrobiales bacterium]
MTSFDLGEPAPSLPDNGPLAELATHATILAEPARADSPWVLAYLDIVVKAYNLAGFRPLDRRRAHAEAEVALELADVPGVVPALSAHEEDDWLLIEMVRMGPSVADHLAAVHAGQAAPYTPQQWATWFERVANTLRELHRRGIVHRDIKPGNLMFDRDGAELLVADFSIASRQRRFRPRPEAQQVEGTDRYISPEQLRGRLGPAADQYALGVTAAEAFATCGTTPAVDDVLRRATSHEPEHRYPAIDDFGLALREAVDDTAPRRLSRRLERVAPAWREGWVPGLMAALITYVVVLLMRSSAVNPQTGLIVPALVFGLICLLFRMSAFLRRGRTRPRLPFADRPWFPLVLFAIAFVAGAPFMVSEPSLRGKVFTYSAVGSVALASWLGATRHDAGGSVIAMVRHWERRRARHREQPLRWWGGRAILLGVLAVLAFLPVAVAHQWPSEPSGPSTGEDMWSTQVVARFRERLLAGNVARACRSVRFPPDAGNVPCATWAQRAATWMRQEVAAGAPRLTVGQLGDVGTIYASGGDRFGRPFWTLRDGATGRTIIGDTLRTDQHGRVWEVDISRLPPKHEPGAESHRYWNYEVALSKGKWYITSVSACDTRQDPICLHLSNIAPADLPSRQP